MYTSGNALKQFRYVNRLKAIELANYLGVGRSFISNMESGRAPLPAEQLEKILANEFGWDTSMFNEHSINTSAKAVNNSSVSVNINSNNGLVENEDRTQAKASKVATIPIIPLDACAGSLGEIAGSAMEYQCERMVSPIAGATCAIRVAGDSMSPSINNGDIAVLKKINENVFVEWGKVHVLDTCNGALIKEIRKTDKPDYIECVSLNPDPKYQPFEVCTEYINGWYRVLMIMSLR